jgi:hypothetical protein
MFDFDPSKAGAETKADFGVFLVGTAVGGAVDAIFNLAGFAEPLVFAGICGAGARVRPKGPPAVVPRNNV